MSNFSLLKTFLDKRQQELFAIAKTTGNPVLTMQVQSPHGSLSQHYVESWPAEANQVFRERREMDCNADRHYIRNIGNICVYDADGVKQHLWNAEHNLEGAPAVLYANMSQAFTSSITGVFALDISKVGSLPNLDNYDFSITWDHFYLEVPDEYVMEGGVAAYKGSVETARATLARNHAELSLEHARTILELIDATDDTQLYRGEQYRCGLLGLISFLETELTESFLWREAVKMRGKANFRNNPVGQLLVNLSEGMKDTVALKKYYDMVDPTKFNHSQTLLTPAMKKRAAEAIKELGYQDSIQRRPAVATDINVNDILFSNAVTNDAGDILDMLVPDKTCEVDENATDIGIEDFIATVVPKVSSIEAYFAPELKPNAMTLVAPVHKDSKPLTPWDNNFSWCYAGGITDSGMKEKVRKAGGNTEGDLRISLGWHNADDLDLHANGNGFLIYFGHKRSHGGALDVDMNYGGNYNSVDPVENIIFPSDSQIRGRSFDVEVNQMNCKGRQNPGFYVEIETKEGLRTYKYPEVVHGKVKVATIDVDSQGNYSFTDYLEADSGVSEVQGAQTKAYHTVSMLMLSPNHWGDNAKGNKHYFFILDDMDNKEPVRGIFNEFLCDDLKPHRKTMQHLGEALRAHPQPDQLSGLGFSSTKRDSLNVRVRGEINRTYNIKF